MSIRGVTPPKGSRFAKGGFQAVGKGFRGSASSSIRNRIHPNGYIVGGLHDKGLKHRAAGQTAGMEYWRQQIALGNIKWEHKTYGRYGVMMRYKIKKTPHIAFGSPDELALLRAQHFLRDNEGIWLVEHDFDKRFRAIYDNLVDAFKN